MRFLIKAGLKWQQIKIHGASKKNQIEFVKSDAATSFFFLKLYSP